MPFVNVRTARGLLDPARKARLHEEITDLLVRIEGRGDPGFRKYVLVLIEEHPAESWSAGGHGMTGEDVASLARAGSDT
jgi:phenylpyruvate tautomerase PptA (4-oxalocrotonate tautomerase family)